MSSPRYYCYVHFSDLARNLVHDIYVHPLEFPSANAAFVGAAKWEAGITDHLPMTDAGGCLRLSVDAQSPAEARKRVVELGVKQGWRGLVFIDRPENAAA